ncbi:pyridoxal-phosphate dependent enzyme [Pseudoruegeria sp. HB172150]|uniref:pyridoxal-phosphate dependent enzyme n=1 Tax=Pseudoruegeria sp. HB172150 TaxID=2721164 RepID=UPI001553262A|nr:pyridoxal-phosphate dependent enzyme [Pseudoruegeria sp. HB172150]
MRILSNPYRGTGLDIPVLADVPYPLTEPVGILTRHPRYAETPLVELPDLARAAGVGHLHVKDERGRMGLGSFKALGAAHVIARDAEAGLAEGRTYVTASAGNHGMSVAFGAATYGACARVYLAETVPESFAGRLRAEGAEVVRAGETYEESMAAAAQAADAEGLALLSDSSWPGYTERPLILMEGYLTLMAEVFGQIPEPPTHIFLQAGVGGLAGAAAAITRAHWGDGPRIVVVEPEAAPALTASIEAGKPVIAPGPVSIMGRLDCKEPSLIALKGLARDADEFVTISEEEAVFGSARADEAGLASTPSGVAGIAAVMVAAGGLSLGPDSRVLTMLTEQAEP